MAQVEKGVELNRVARSEIDANPPAEVKKKIEEGLARLKPKR